MTLKTVDVHVAGAAVRMVIGGTPAMTGDSLLERADGLMASAGTALIALCREPRGHAGTIVAVLAEPDRADADAGLLFVNGDGLVPLSGEGLIGAVTIALERQLILPRHVERLQLDTLSGAVTARPRASRTPGGVTVAYAGPEAMVIRANHAVTFAARTVHVDLVWTGAGVAAIVDAEAAGAPLVAARLLELQRAGRDLIDALDAVRLADPETGAITQVSRAVFIGAPPEHAADILSGTVHRGGRVERAPGGDATVAVATVLSAMGVLAPGQRLVHQGIIGTTLGAEVSAIEDRDGRALVTVEVEGDAWPIGELQFAARNGEPLAEGVVL